ncbi:MAG: PQQ-dependent sugar dehydrogenase [Gammaproteobacteria bacterium]|nr:PQQ-dependent sugar dehydrogenase [Gammaproteobacteria bacterium]
MKHQTGHASTGAAPRGALFACLALALAAGTVHAERTFSSEKHDFRVVTLVHDLEHPWSLAFLPGGDMLVTERAGRLLRIDGATLDRSEVSGVPAVAAYGQGGLLDVILHPRFEDNGWIYISFAAGEGGELGTEIARARLDGDRLTDVEVIFRALPKSGGGRHFGSRLVFGTDGLLYATLGERGDRPRAQDLGDHAGSIVRLRDDGSVPEDNPFVDMPGAKPEIFTYGNRNPQGMALEPGTGRIWEHEHGPQGGDEVNIVRAGVNYGWPVITYGRNYGIGTRIGEGTHKTGMAQPEHYWVPSIAPSGMAFYDGDRFPRWRRSLFVGALKDRLLVRLEVDGERIVHEERMLEDVLGRIRDVRSGPDGYLYLLTDHDDGVLARLEPAG